MLPRQRMRAYKVKQMEWRLAIGAGAIQPDAPVFATIECGLMSPDNLSRDWRRVVIARGPPRVPFHALRHTHASLLIASGVDIIAVSRRLGHGKASVTLDVYGHLVGGAAEAAAAAIGKVLK